MGRVVRLSRKLGKLLGNRTYRRGLLHGVAAAIEHRDIIARLKPDLIIDVGANSGQFSLMVRGILPEAGIIAFEPLNEPAKKFRSLFEMDRRTKLHICAVGPTAGEADIHVSKRMDSSSLLPISHSQVEFFPGTEEVGVRKISIQRLTDIVEMKDLSRRTLLKIDVQGYELGVLQSAAPLLPLISWVYVEVSYVPLYDGQELADQIVTYLEGNDFKLVQRNNIVSVGGVEIQADLLFEGLATRSGCLERKRAES